MTELAEILQTAKDTIFTVEFKKKVSEKDIVEKLEEVVQSGLKDLAKQLSDGKLVTLTGHLVESELHTGRTLMIDLEN